jgi:ABC-type multidrug transport system permease subunit
MSHFMRHSMRKFLALLVARNKEFYRDKGTLGWTFLFPFIVLAGFAYGYSGRQDPLLQLRATPAAAVDAPALKAVGALPGVKLVGADDPAAALQKLERYEVDAVVTAGPGGTLTYRLNEDSDKGRLAEHLLREAAGPGARLVRVPVAGRHIRYADWLLPGLLAMNIMFGSMFGVGYVIVRYRKNGVLKRLRATPLGAFQFLAAQLVSRMLLMVLTSWVVLLGARVVIGFRPQGSWLDFTVFLAISAMAMIAVGLVVAARIASEEVADGILNMMTWPMIFLSGIWFSLDGASPWVLRAAQLVPLKHVVDGLRAILIEGAPIAQLGPQIAVLAAISVALTALGSAIFRWR